MGILLLILKIIGVLLALILLLVFAVMVVPIRYRAHLEMQEEIAGMAVFHWCWHFIDLRIQYGKQTAFRVHILGIPVQLGGEKKPKKIKKRKRIPKHKQEKLSPALELPDGQGQLMEDISIQVGDLDEAEESMEEVERSEQSIDQNTESKDLKKKRTTVKKRSDKKRSQKRKGFRELWQGIQNLVSVIRQHITELYHKQTTIKEQFCNIKNIILEETNKSALFHVLQEFKLIIGHFVPRKAYGELSFGMEDPARTGQILGILSLFPFWTRYKINLIPDFQSDIFYIKGELDIKGHIRCWHFLLSLFRLIKDKNIRTFITQVRR